MSYNNIYSAKLVSLGIILSISWLFSSTIRAQRGTAAYGPFGCQSNFYQLQSNQLHLLSVNAHSELTFVPALDTFERPLSILSYNTADGYLYSMDTLTHDLLRIHRDGTLEELGVPKHKETKQPLKAWLYAGEIMNDILCAFAPLEDRFYWIDLSTNTFETSPNELASYFTNFAIHPTEKVLYGIGGDNRIFEVDTEQQEIRIGDKVEGLPHGPRALGNIWITREGRVFVTRKKGREFYTLKRPEMRFYTLSCQWSHQGVGDGTSCPQAYAPAVIEQDVLELWWQKPKKGNLQFLWNAGHEWNNERYFLQESPNQKYWKNIAEKPSFGDNDRINPYRALNRNYNGQKKYYRLLKKYKNSTVGFSRTVIVGRDSLEEVVLSPKVSTQKEVWALQLFGLKNKEVEITIFNTLYQPMGQRQLRVLDDQLMVNLSLGILPTGTYSVRITTKENVYWEYCFVGA